MDNRDERRAKMLEKVRKLLAMGRHESGNENEQDIAMRQANRIMAEFGIAEAECDMTAINAGEMIFGEAQCTPDGRAPEPGKVFKTAPSWAGVLGMGCAWFTDSIIARKRTGNGEIFVFKGEKQDVLLARWLFGVLVGSIQVEQKASGWTGRGDANSFRMAAAGTLQRRLMEMAKERREMYEAAKRTSNSTALVVVDRKRTEIAQRFGAQKTRSSRGSYHSSGAAIAGKDAGQRINIPSGRPVGNNSRTMLQ